MAPALDPRIDFSLPPTHELFRSLTAALPNSMDFAGRLALARSFAEHVTAGQLPYTLALHAGISKEAGVANKGRGYKRALYAKHAVAEYWLIDPAAETVWIHRPRSGSLAVAHTFGREQTLRSPLLAGFKLDLDDVFA